METLPTEPDEVPEKEMPIAARLSAQSVLSPEELQRTIGEVRTAAEAEQARLSHPLPPTLAWNRRPVMAVLIVMTAVAIWSAQLFLMRPPEVVITNAAREDVLRYQVMLQIAKIEEYRERTGRLPNTLKETAKEFPAMTYSRIDSLRYRLQARDSGIFLSFRSDSSLSAFLGGSLMRMREPRLK